MAFNDDLVADIRAHGKVTSGPFLGRDVLLLTTRGKKSGLERTSPLVYSRDGDRLVIIASKGGSPTNPGWFHNLKASPVVTIELGGERFSARAAAAEPESERRRLYDQHSVKNPAFRDYEKKTTRRIPVVILERLSPTAA
jgi:deazaflavin-dependent oxidoreductase (nitroreductase family)